MTIVTAISLVSAAYAQDPVTTQPTTAPTQVTYIDFEDVDVQGEFVAPPLQMVTVSEHRRWDTPMHPALVQWHADLEERRAEAQQR